MHKGLMTATLLAATAASHAAPIELYEQPQLRGAMLGLQDATARLSDYNFNDRPLSMVVRSGQWEVCTDADFRGQCQVFGPGDYRDLPPTFVSRISSVRPVGGGVGGGVLGTPGVQLGGILGGAGVFGPLTGQGTSSHAAVTLYADTRFSGQRLDVSGAIADLRQQGFNDQASSFEVHQGSWQFCADVNYGGDCQVLGPGRYDVASYWNDRLSSLRPAYGSGQQASAGGSGVTLYRDINGGGATLFVAGATPNLQQHNFNDTASSVEISSGTWQLCVDANYSGYCTTLGPGRHNLSGPLQDGLSSLRPLGGWGQQGGWSEGNRRSRDMRF